MSTVDEQLAPLVLEDVLAGDGVPDANQSLNCMSCGTPMTALHCGACGQRNDDYRRSLWSLAVEAVTSFTALESRIWRTWANLLARPGRVAREYADGRRTHWSSPVRVYIFMSIMLFGFMEVTDTYFVALEAEPRHGASADASPVIDIDNLSVTAHFFTTQSRVEGWNEGKDFRAIRSAMERTTSDMGMLRDIADELGADADGAGLSLPDIARIDAVLSDPEGVRTTPAERAEVLSDLRGVRAIVVDRMSESGIKSEALEELDALIARLDTTHTPAPPSPSSDGAESDNMVIDMSGGTDLELNGEPVNEEAAWLLWMEFLQNPAVGNSILNRWLPRIILLMMPVTMLIGAMFIRGRRRPADTTPDLAGMPPATGLRKARLRRKRDRKAGRGHDALLFDHLVHAAYIHAVAFALVFAGIIVARVTGAGAGLAAGIVIAMLIYLPLSLKRMFARGWVKTIWTAYGVGFIYTIIVVVLTAIAVTLDLQDLITERQRLLDMR